MSANYDQISFCSLAAAFLTFGAVRTFRSYINSIRTKKKPVKDPKQVEVWINSYSSFNSVVSYIGFLTETYYYGGRLLINLVSISIGYIFAFLVLQPFFYDMGVKSPYEYLQKRFNNRLSCRLAAASFAIIFHICFSTLFLWANATILSTIFSGLELWVSLTVIGVISTLFASTGGLLQSTHMNLLQFILFLFGILAALIISIVARKDNLSYYWDLAKSYGRQNFIVTSGDLRVRYTVWNQLFSLPIPWCAFHGLLIPNVNRYKQIKSKATSSLFIISHLPIMFIVNSIGVFSGIFSFITYYDCDPYLTYKIDNKNQIASYWLIDMLKTQLPSVAGLCLGSLFVYAIMQHSFGMSLAVQIFINDILNPIVFYKTKSHLKELYLHILKPLLIIIACVLSILYSLSFQYVRNSILSLFFLFNNSINSPILGLFLLAMFNPFANYFGAISSFLITLVINFWLGISAVTTNSKSQEFVQNTEGCNATVEHIRFVNSNNTYYPENETLHYLYTISSIWYCLFSLLFILIFGSLFSLIFSLIVKRRFDFDFEFKTQRKEYLYHCKKHTVFQFCKRNDRNDNDDQNVTTQL